MSDRDRIDQIVFQATGADGAVVAFISFANGDVGITIRGRAVPGCRWDHERIDACIDAFAALAGLNVSAATAAAPAAGWFGVIPNPDAPLEA